MKIKPIIVYVDWLRFFSNKKYIASGVTLFPFICIHKNLRDTIDGLIKVNHESIHFEQMKETFVIGFYLIYAVNFLRNLFRAKPYQAYKTVMFEQEAFDCEKELKYLESREKYVWMWRY